MVDSPSLDLTSLCVRGGSIVQNSSQSSSCPSCLKDIGDCSFYSSTHYALLQAIAAPIDASVDSDDILVAARQSGSRLVLPLDKVMQLQSKSIGYQFEPLELSVRQSSFIVSFGDRFSLTFDLASSNNQVSLLARELVMRGATDVQLIRAAGVLRDARFASDDCTRVSQLWMSYYSRRTFDVDLLVPWTRCLIGQDSVLYCNEVPRTMLLHPALYAVYSTLPYLCDMKRHCRYPLMDSHVMRVVNFIRFLNQNDFDVKVANAQMLRDMLIITHVKITLPLIPGSPSDRYQVLAMLGDSVLRTHLLRANMNFPPKQVSDIATALLSNAVMTTTFNRSLCSSLVDYGPNSTSIGKVSATAFEAMTGFFDLHCPRQVGWFIHLVRLST